MLIEKLSVRVSRRLCGTGRKETGTSSAVLTMCLMPASKFIARKRDPVKGHRTEMRWSAGSASPITQPAQMALVLPPRRRWSKRMRLVSGWHHASESGHQHRPWRRGPPFFRRHCASDVHRDASWAANALSAASPAHRSAAARPPAFAAASGQLLGSVG